MCSISVQNVTKRFGKVAALRSISFNPKRGVNIILGRNGAGKSTLLKTIAGFYKPDEGSVTVLGKDPYTSSAVKQQLSILTDNYALYDFLTIRKNLEFFGRLYGMNSNEALSSVRETLKNFGIYSMLDSRVYTLSRGTKQKVAFCRAILNDPEILLLDEPTAFLDANASNVIRDYIQLNANVKQTIFVTQKIDEVARTSGFVYIMKDGRIVRSTSINGMYKSVLKGMIINIRFARPVSFSAIKSMPGIQDAHAKIVTISRIRISNYKDISAAIDFLRGKGIDIVGIDYIEPFVDSIS